MVTAVSEMFGHLKKNKKQKTTYCTMSLWCKYSLAPKSASEKYDLLQLVLDIC